MPLDKFSAEDVQRAVAKLRLMRFSPTDTAILVALGEQLALICHDKPRLEWLVNRACAIYPEWPGVAELRALYSSRWRPADGMRTYSAVYGGPDGDCYPDNDVEGQRLSKLLLAPRHLPAPDTGAVHSETPPVDVQALAASKAFPEPKPTAPAKRTPPTWPDGKTQVTAEDLAEIARRLKTGG